MASKGTKSPTKKASEKYVGEAVLGSGGSFWTAKKAKNGRYMWVPFVTKMGVKGHVKTKTKKRSDEH